LRLIDGTAEKDPSYRSVAAGKVDYSFARMHPDSPRRWKFKASSRGKTSQMRRFAIAFAVIAVLPLEACSQKPDPTNVRPIGEVSVDDTLSVAKMVKEGHYDAADKDISAVNFPISRKDAHTTQMVLLTFGRRISSDQAENLIRARKEGLRPANLDECLAYGAALEKARLNYDLARPNHAIACLGQSAKVGGVRRVPTLWSVENGAWDLGLDDWDRNWNARERFLAAVKE
jgi:hypothetical protein